MGEGLHADDASLDSLIQWLRSERAEHPTESLSALLAGRRIDTQRLVEIACIDLMERRRMGQAIRVEIYTEQFPQLQRDELLLDLIDAEICVSGELQQPIDPSDYQRRFPKLAKQIIELVSLDSDALSSVPPIVGAPGRPLSTHDDEDLDPSASFSVDLVVSGDRVSSVGLPQADGHPLRVPEWFSAEKCFASGPGRWLIRGRDSLRGVVMAMKVIQLPAQLHPAQFRQILDACEAASQVRNPIWVPPTVAAIQRQHLGVVRPWVFAVSWQTSAATRPIATQLGDLASIAYCLEAAHRVGATHGGIHGENILLDHDGKLRIVDAVANWDGMQRWCGEVDPSLSQPSIMSLQRRKQIDMEDLIRLIASLSVSWRRTWTKTLFDEVATIAKGDSDGAFGALGAVLMRHADRDAEGFQSNH